jgi:hypothetical protein
MLTKDAIYALDSSSGSFAEYHEGIRELWTSRSSAPGVFHRVKIENREELKYYAQ